MRKLFTVIALLTSAVGYSQQLMPLIPIVPKVSEVRGYIGDITYSRIYVPKNDVSNDEAGIYYLCDTCMSHPDDSVKYIPANVDGYGTGYMWQWIGYTNNVPNHSGQSGKMLVSNGIKSSWVAPKYVTSSLLSVAMGNALSLALSLADGTTVTSNAVTLPSSFTFANTSFDSTQRSFNTAYQVSSSKYSEVSVTAQVSANLSLSGGQSGIIYVEYSADGSTNWQYAGRIASGNTGTLTIGLNTTQSGSSAVNVKLPPSYYWRARTTGNATFTFKGGYQTIYN